MYIAFAKCFIWLQIRSLNKYGRFIFGETYVAMKGGGTSSNVYDLLKQLRITPSDALAVKDNTVIAYTRCRFGLSKQFRYRVSRPGDHKIRQGLDRNERCRS